MQYSCSIHRECTYPIESNLNLTNTGTEKGTEMRTLLHTALWIALLIASLIALLIEPLYLSLVRLSSIVAKYDYCYDTVQATKYYLPKPDFTKYSLKSEPECKK